MAKRIQRKRVKGWRMPENTVYVGRGSRYGNPWRVGKIGRMTAEQAVANYRGLLDAQEDSLASGASKFGFSIPCKEDIRRDLKGKNLACWCKEGYPCHADVLLEIANKP